MQKKRIFDFPYQSVQNQSSEIFQVHALYSLNPFSKTYLYFNQKKLSAITWTKKKFLHLHAIPQKVDESPSIKPFRNTFTESEIFLRSSMNYGSLFF